MRFWTTLTVTDSLRLISAWLICSRMNNSGRNGSTGHTSRLRNHHDTDHRWPIADYSKAQTQGSADSRRWNAVTSINKHSVRRLRSQNHVKLHHSLNCIRLLLQSILVFKRGSPNMIHLFSFLTVNCRWNSSSHLNLVSWRIRCRCLPL